MKLSGAEVIMKLLERQGIETIAGIPGGANLPIYDAMEDSGIRHVLTRHEQGAGFIAQGMARTTGKAAVCFATSGPGATNLLTSIADAKLDSIPIIAITGQVPTSLIGTDAFQEVDMYGLTLPITKHNFIVQSADDLLDVIPRAFKIAQSGRPGPVAIDIPKDVQTEKVEFDQWPDVWEENNAPFDDHDKVNQAASMIHNAERPVLYIGGGVVASDSSEIIQRLAKLNSIPACSTLMGLGCFPDGDPMFIGMLGMHGAEYTNIIMDEADLVIAVGVRFDDRATGKAEQFCKHADIIHIDIDRSEIDKIKLANLSISGDLKSVLEALVQRMLPDKRTQWNSRVDALRTAYPLSVPENGDGPHPIELIRHIGRIADNDAIIATDVGQHQMWVAQAYPFKKPRSFLTSGGLGTMGFGMPAAIGASLANPDRQVICVSGDGSFQMNIQELATLAEQNLNVTVIILNNGRLGLVRQQQELFYNKRYAASKFEVRPDFAAIARGYGIEAYDLVDCADPFEMMTNALSSTGPCIINAPIDWTMNVLPMVPPGASNMEMIGGECHDKFSDRIKSA